MDSTDKRRSSIEEILRFAQASGQFFADELETDADFSDFDVVFFRRCYKKDYKEKLEKIDIHLEQLLKNLLFCRIPRFFGVNILLPNS